MIADCLTWKGAGVYVCNFCQETFEPPRPTASSLPLARKHVVTVHKMNHLRKAKMSWTQGVEGLNMKKKAQRKELKEEQEGGFEEQEQYLWVKQEGEGVVERREEVEEGREEVVLEQLYFVPEEIGGTEEVVVNTMAEEQEEEEIEQLEVDQTEPLNCHEEVQEEKLREEELVSVEGDVVSPKIRVINTYFAT